MFCTSAPVWLTAQVIGWSLLLQLVIGGAISWQLARRQWAGNPWLDVLVTLPLVFPPIVLGYALLLLLGRHSWLMQALPHWMQPEVIFTPTGLVVAAFVAGLPLMVKPTQNAFASTPSSLREAAATFGLSAWQIFWRVELPLARRGIAAGLMLAGGRGLGEVGLSLMLGGNIVGRTETLSLAIFNQVLDGNLACANQLSLLLCVLAIPVFLMLRRLGSL